MRPPTSKETRFHARSTRRDVRIMHLIKAGTQRLWWLNRLKSSSSFYSVSAVTVVVLDREVMEETIHPHTSTSWSPRLWGHSALPNQQDWTNTKHTHDSSSESHAHSRWHLHAALHTLTFLCKKNQCAPLPHRHHHNQHSFVEEERRTRAMGEEKKRARETDGWMLKAAGECKGKGSWRRGESQE